MKRLIVVDVSSFIFRAFYAIRPLTSPQGVPVNAVYGVLNMLTKLITQYKPTHLLIAKDTKGGSFRNQVYTEYKANRSEPPDDLRPQFSIIQELIEKMHLPFVEIENYEADDIIGSSVVQFQEQFDEVLIASGDKDLMQFVNEKVRMLDSMKDVIYGPKEVFEKMGVYPNQIVDYLSLIGDSSDNIPGVKGIGSKGAEKLLEEFGTLESIIQNVDKIANKRVKTGLTEHVEDAYLSKKLIQIVTNLDMQINLDKLELHLKVDDTLIDFLKGLGFNTTIKKLQDFVANHNGDKQAKIIEKKQIQENIQTGWNENFLKQQILAIHFNWKFSENYDQVIDLLGISDGPHLYQLNSKIEIEKLITTYHGTFILHDAKELYNYCHWNKLKISFKVIDLSIMHFLLNPSMKHTLDFMAQEYLGDEILEMTELPVKAQSVFNLKQPLEQKLSELDMTGVYQNVEIPLIPILSKMETYGVNLNSNYYQELDGEFEKELNEIELEIASFCKEEVNLKSPKQVSKLLFEELGLPILKKTKTGASTDAEVLTELVSMKVHPVPELLLKYRELDKLLSTYIRALPKLINPKTHKLHTTFQQTNAATGRLSSDNPNLQNIPVRTENGRKLRRGFYTSQGTHLLSADYSQVELRILAHFSEDPIMLEAFKQNKDIHQQTAAEIFDEDISMVSKDQRNSAKAINFGLMYGQSSFGLSKQLGITRNEARDYITHYFERFSRVKIYLDSLKELCEKTGYAETLFGRKRLLPDILSTNRTVKSMAERVAINSPIQGTAADIIKIAMIKIDHKLSDLKLKSKMILQVHDELIFEVPENELEQMKKLVVDEMENAVKLKIPLKVDFGVGQNWYDLK